MFPGKEGIKVATPKSRTSHKRTSQRKAHFLGALTSPCTTICPHCGEVAQTHRACPECGYYRGRQIVVIKSTAKEKAES
ncbi:MAG: 50S ribosomal protein L32 [Thermovirgaceae bacterium]|nr:50S ribosomal protein L32 [Thermovirgaceae bacterium]